ncbi:hypothetical protein GCM10018785_06200 [Streptomyces longispororuber]|uniref:DUF4190 domain-containing protein n=1 Tax=Streptomyces longispororuber TaxID=68230 RepID=A0A919DEP3_9ACTN|nr:hypothetical protein [Streptomyces longispororuber]GHE39356.1 hypothetical protein GCM10018785_06200 [Streptomyces longispororuber]
MTTQYGNQPVGQHHAPARSGAGENVLSIIAIVMGAIGFLFLPIVFGLGGLILALIAKFARHERLSTIALIVGAVGLIGGMILGAIVAG